MKRPVKSKESPFTMTMDQAHRDKLQRMLGFCLMNGAAASSGAILRTLLDNAPDQSPEFVRQVKARLEREKSESLEKRRKR